MPKGPKGQKRAADALYSFCRVNSSVRMSPAMAGGPEQCLWNIGDIVNVTEEWEAADVGATVLHRCTDRYCPDLRTSYADIQSPRKPAARRALIHRTTN